MTETETHNKKMTGAVKFSRGSVASLCSGTSQVPVEQCTNISGTILTRNEHILG